MALQDIIPDNNLSKTHLIVINFVNHRVNHLKASIATESAKIIHNQLVVIEQQKRRKHLAGEKAWDGNKDVKDLTNVRNTKVQNGPTDAERNLLFHKTAKEIFKEDLRQERQRFVRYRLLNRHQEELKTLFPRRSHRIPTPRRAWPEY
jgi:hypothetical protein